MHDIIISGGTVVTLDENRRIIKDGAIVVNGNRIEQVGKKNGIAKKFKADTEIDAEGKFIFPGLINTHDHMFQVMLRNLGVDLPLLEWLKNIIHPAVAKLKKKRDWIHTSALLGCVENIKSGNTYVLDNHYAGRNGHYDAVIEAMIKTGIRGCLARGIYEMNAHEDLIESPDEAIPDCERLVKKWHKAADGRIMVCVAPMHPCQASKRLLLEAKDLSDEYGVLYHMHTAESRGDQELNLKMHGKTDVEFLNELGILSPRYISVHSVWLSKKEIGYLAQSGAHVVHNPVSNMYIGDGVAPIPELMDAGVNVSLGTDGAASNNNQDLIQSMKFAACLHKVSKLDPAVITAQDVLEMATINGARALGLEHEIGSIEVGKKADLIIVDMEKPHIAPVHDPIASLVYCANGSDVNTVIIDGKIVMKERKILTVDETEVLKKANEVDRELLKRVRFKG